jgi:hypothetical protein
MQATDDCDAICSFEFIVKITFNGFASVKDEATSNDSVRYRNIKNKSNDSKASPMDQLIVTLARGSEALYSW